MSSDKLLRGKYSGNVRLDPRKEGFEEPDVDNEFTKDMYLLSDDVRSDPDFKKEISDKLDNWKKAISLTADPSEITVHTVGESHIDVAWLWRFEQTREKAYKTFKKACEHGDILPDRFVYALSEPLLLEWVKEDHPDTFEEIVKKVKTGNIELVGGSYVEPDCMMPSGEAFIRMRLYGMRFLNRHFGVLPEVEWFLDSFGYNYGLPQILVKSGAKYFWTSKLTWNLDTRFPFVYFLWRGPDGSEILTANFPMGTGLLDNWIFYDVGMRPLLPDGKKVWCYRDDYDDLADNVDENEIIPHVGNFFGKGDGGHGPTHQEVCTHDAYCNDPLFKWSRVHNFYREIEKWKDRLPVWNDELYLENHRGTFSVHAEVKRYNRKNECSLTAYEALSVMTALINNGYKIPYSDFETLWKITLKNQFHDVLPGSSIPEVYDDCWDDWTFQQKVYDRIGKEIGEILDGTFESEYKNEKEEYIYIFNPLGYERHLPVFIPATVLYGKEYGQKPPYVNITDAEGNRYICQPVEADDPYTIDPRPPGWYCIPRLRPLTLEGFKVTEEEKVDTSDGPFKVEDEKGVLKISNGIITLGIKKEDGAFVYLESAEIGNRNLLKGDVSNLTMAWEDRPKNWPAWNLEHYWNYPIEVNNSENCSVEVTERGPVFITVEIKKTILGNPVTQKIRLFDGIPVIYLEYHTDWSRPKTLIKIPYSTATDAEYSTADGVYCLIKRRTEPSTPCDKARFEKIMHKFCDVSTPDNTWGIALLNEGKYAFDTEMDKGTLRITMLRTPEYPKPAAEAWVNAERKFNREKYGHEPPQYSGLGKFTCRYAIYPHKYGADIKPNGEPNPKVRIMAEEFNAVLPVIKSGGTPKNKVKVSLLSITPENVILGALKPEEWNTYTDRIVLRIAEGCGKETNCTICFDPIIAENLAEIYETDLIERPVENTFVYNSAERCLEFKLGPFEIKTFVLVAKHPITER